MQESILKTIKSLLQLEEDITDFDNDLIVLINSSLSKLYQVGIGAKAFRITGGSETWDQLLTNEEYLDAIKEVVYIDVKLVFDPPTSSMVMEALKGVRQEDVDRIEMQIEATETKDPEDQDKYVVDYNTDVINKPTLDGTLLQGDVQMNLASKDYVDNTIGEIEDGYY